MMPGPPKITLDQESFKALASEVRVEVLKRLDERRATVTDLSNLLRLSKPTLLEHLEKLQTAGLVKRIDEGRKWIYYELSDKGRKILHPERASIVVSLSSAIALAAIGVLYLIFAGTSYQAPGAAFDGRNATSAPSSPVENFWTSSAGGVPVLSILLLVLSVACVGIFLYLRWWGRRRREELFAELGSA